VPRSTSSRAAVALTADFFATYTNRMPGTVVHFLSCYLASSDKLATVFLDKGASSFSGYDSRVTYAFASTRTIAAFSSLAAGGAVGFPSCTGCLGFDTSIGGECVVSCACVGCEEVQSGVRHNACAGARRDHCALHALPEGRLCIAALPVRPPLRLRRLHRVHVARVTGEALSSVSVRRTYHGPHTVDLDGAWWTS
jgi:hypothetical protein